MKRYFKYIISITLVLSGSTLLDKERASELGITYELSSGPNLDHIINGAYHVIQGENNLGGLYNFYPTIVTDILKTNPDEISRVRLFEEYNRSVQLFGSQLWASSYDAINAVNNVIDRIESDELPFTENGTTFYDRNKDRILGEAYFIRGVMFFELCRIWGKQF